MLGAKTTDEILSCEVPIGQLDLSRGDKAKMNNIEEWIVEPERPSEFAKHLIRPAYIGNVFKMIDRPSRQKRKEQEESKKSQSKMFIGSFAPNL